MSAQTASTHDSGVSGEFHSFGTLLSAATAARAAGFPAERLYFVGQRSTDRLGEPLGFVMPASFATEMTRLGVTLGLLTGVIWSLALPHEALLPALALNAGGGALLGWVLGGLVGYLSLSARIGGYLHAASAGALRLRIALAGDGSAAAGEQAAERALQVLRAARAESLWLSDGRREFHSPQTENWGA